MFLNVELIFLMILFKQRMRAEQSRADSAGTTSDPSETTVCEYEVAEITGECSSVCKSQNEKSSDSSVRRKEDDAAQHTGAKRMRTPSFDLLDEHSYSRIHFSSFKSSEDSKRSDDAISQNVFEEVGNSEENMEIEDARDDNVQNIIDDSVPDEISILSQTEDHDTLNIESESMMEAKKDKSNPSQSEINSDHSKSAETSRETRRQMNARNELNRLKTVTLNADTDTGSPRGRRFRKRLNITRYSVPPFRATMNSNRRHGSKPQGTNPIPASSVSIINNKRKMKKSDCSVSEDLHVSTKRLRAEVETSRNSNPCYIPAPSPPIGLQLWIYKSIYNIAFAKSPRGFIYKCLIEGCHFQTLVKESVYEHLQKRHEKQAWNGFCQICMDVIVRDKGIFEEFAHLENHVSELSLEISNSSRSQEAPTDSSNGEKDQKSAALKATLQEMLRDLLRTSDKIDDDKAFPQASSSKRVKKRANSTPALNSTKIAKPALTSKPIAKAAAELPQKSKLSPAMADIKIRSSPSEPKDDKFLNQKLLRPWLKTGNANKKMNDMATSMQSKTCISSYYKCMSSTCCFFSSDMDIFEIHLAYHQEFTPTDESNFLLCAYCEFRGSTRKLLIAHIDNNHLHDRFLCSYCFYRSCSDFNVQIHQSIAHKLRPISVIKCEETTPRDTRSEIEKVKKDLSKNVPPIICFFCRGIFYVLQHYKDHVKSHILGPGDQIRCVKCGKITTKDCFHEHLGKCLNVGMFQCVYCEHGADSFELLSGHIAHEHSSNLPLFYERINSDNTNGTLKNVSVANLF